MSVSHLQQYKQYVHRYIVFLRPTYCCIMCQHVFVPYVTGGVHSIGVNGVLSPRFKALQQLRQWSVDEMAAASGIARHGNE